MSNDQQLTDIPQEVKELQAALGDFAAFRTILRAAMIPGNMSEPMTKFQKFIEDGYKQLLDKFNEHPYVIQARKDAEEASKK